MKFFTLLILLSAIGINCLAQVPTISSFAGTSTPGTSAASGTTVTINGTNFTGATAVTFGGTPAASFIIVSPTKITAIVGNGASGSVTVTTPGGTGSKTGFYYLALSGIITDYGGFWSSTTNTINSTQTNSSHNLLAFSYNGTTYSTGADDGILTSNGITFTGGSFKALPISGISGNTPSSGSTYIALAKNVDGNTSSADASSVSGYTLQTVLTDGTNGLNLGTGITNLPVSATLRFDISNINTSNISDAEPDIMITQIADPSTGNDVFQFINVSGTNVGNSVTQDMTLLSPMGNYLVDLFNLTPNTPYNSATVYTANLSNSPKQIRVTAFKLSDFGITSGNSASVKALKVTPGGNSDYAFIAYNVNSFNLPPSIAQNAAATNSSVCAAGTANLAIIADAASGGTLTYSWEHSTNSGASWTLVTDGGSFSGATTNKLSIAAPANNDQYRATVTESGSGLTNTSAAFTIAIVSPAAPTAVSVSGTTSTCINTAVIITSTVTGGSNLYYQWQSDASGSYEDIPGANINSYEPPVNVAGVISYKLTVSSGNGCASLTSATPATITVSALSVGGSISGSATVCSGTNSTLLTLSGHTGSILRWEYSTNSFSTVTNISNTTSTHTATNLTITTQYRAVVQSGNCTLMYSTPATVTVNASIGGSISGGTSVCTGTNSTTLTLSGYTGTILRWESSTNNFTTVTNIANTTTSLTAVNLTTGTRYRAVIQYGSCAAVNSALAIISVNPLSAGGSVAGSADVCSGTNSTTLTLSGNTGSIVKWQSSEDNFSTSTDIANTTTSLTATNLTATTQYRAVVQSGACTSVNSSAATITVNEISVGGIVSGSASVCTGTNSTPLTLSGSTGTIIKWQSSEDNFSTSTDIANTTTNLTATNLTATTEYRAVVQNGVCAISYSSAATISVNPLSVGGSVSGGTNVCPGTNSTTLNLSGNTGAVVKWQSSIDNFTSDITDVANTTNSLTATNISTPVQYRAVVQSGTCAVSFSSFASLTIAAPGDWIGGASGDYSSAANWCGGIPSPTADVIVPANAIVYVQTDDVTVNSLTIGTGGRLVMQFDYNLNIAAGGSFTNNGSFDASASTGAVSFSGNGIISGTVTFKNITTEGALDFGTGSTIAGNFILQPGGSVTGNAPTYTCPSSNLIYNTGGIYTRGMEWEPVTFGQGYPSNVTIQNNTTINFPVAGDGFICNDLTINAGSALYQDYSSGSAPLSVGRNVTINGILSLGNAVGGDITLGGNWTRNTGGVFNNNQRFVSFIDPGNSIITAPNSIARDVNGAFGGETFYDLYIDKLNTATVSLGSNITVINEVGITGGIFDLMNSDVTLVSNGTTAAHVATLPTVAGVVTGAEIRYGGAGGTGTGRFIVQRYLNIGTGSSSRRWRLLTIPLEATDAPTISTAWQEGVSNADRTAPVNPWPGFGTTITKSNVYNAADGYDQGSTNNPSLYYYSAGGWAVLPTTNTNPVSDHEGYMLFARGSRSIVVSSPGINANPTTLEPKGRISIGDIDKSLLAGFQTIGNPYASAIDFSKASFSNYTSGGTTFNTIPGSTDGIGITYYIWDPETNGSNGVGKFITCSSNGDGTYAVTTNTGGIPEDGTIPSGTAFMITSDNNEGSLTFHESDKLSSGGEINRPYVSGTAQTFTSNLYAGSGAGARLADAVKNIYADYDNAINGQDAISLSTFSTTEALSIAREGSSLAIERRNRITVNDTIFLTVKNLNIAAYQFRFQPSNFNSALSAILEDKFTGISTPLSTINDTDVPFNITSNGNSSVHDRFRIIFRPLQTLPVAIRDIKASQQNNDIAVRWTVENQLNIIKYEVEKSINGRYFTNANTTGAIASQESLVTYNWLDVNAVAGDNFYRIKYVNADGTFAYSKIIKVAIGKSKPFISVYPNPITDGIINLQLNNIPAGNYNIKIINNLGKIVSKSMITHNGGNASQTFTPSGILISGSYQLEIMGADKKMRNVQIVIRPK